MSSRYTSFDEAVSDLRAGMLPSNFDQWDLANENGYMVAHEAAERGMLPKGFDQWDLANDGELTVAHFAAKSGNLPPDFNKWALSTSDGWSVAHAAALHGNLPKNFHLMDLADDHGTTVAHAQEFNKNYNNSMNINTAKKTNIEAVQQLIKKGADVNVADTQGQTPLHAYGDFIASSKIRIGTVIEEGAGVHAHAASDKTPSFKEVSSQGFGGLTMFSETIAKLRKEAELVSESNYKMLMARSHTLEGQDAIFDAASKISGQSKQGALTMTGMTSIYGGVLGFLGVAAANQAAGYGAAGMLSSASTVLAGLGTITVGATALPVAPVIALGAYAAGVAMFAASRSFPFDSEKKIEQANNFQNALLDKDVTKVADLSKEHISLSSWLKGAHNHVVKVLKETFSSKPVHQLSPSDIAILKGKRSESTMSM